MERFPALTLVLLLLVAPGCGEGEGPVDGGAAAAEAGLRHDPGDPVDLSAAGGRLSVRFSALAGVVLSARARAGREVTSFHRQLVVEDREVWRATLDPGAGEYLLEVETPHGPVRLGPHPIPETPFAAVPWVTEGVAYQIFPERFRNGDPGNDTLTLVTDEARFADPALGWGSPTLSGWDDPAGESLCCHQYFGGDLAGVLEGLDHLEGLGVTVLYLNPIFAAGSAHGYDTWDYLEVAPNFGDEALLRTLLDEAHGRGIRLIWDFVPNHVGLGHAAFQDALAQGEASEYWDWFTFHVPADEVQPGNGEHYEGWWDYGSLPELRTGNPEVVDHLLEVATHWTGFGFDGIRVDVAADLANRGFFPVWREAVKTLDPDIYLLGEVWERDPSWLQGNEFDALMNYPLGQGIVEPFARGEWSGPEAAAEMAAHVAAYPEASTAMGFNLIASHDTDRLLVKMGGEGMAAPPGPDVLARHRLAAAVLFALPGMPVTFQGDECGYMGPGDQLATRYPIQWEDCDPDFVAHYTELARLKREAPALRSAAFRSHPGAGSLLAFYRGEPGAGEVLAVFNNGAAAEEVALPEGSWTDLATGSVVQGTLPVPGLGWRFLERR